MLPLPEKIFSKCQKIPNKIFTHISRYSMCMRQVLQKTDIFCVLCKKIKKSRATFILAPKIIFFTNNTKMSYSREKTLYEHYISRSTRKKNCHNIFNILIFYKIYFKNREHMLLVAKTPPTLKELKCIHTNNLSVGQKRIFK
jgi:hypothetical protein